MHFVPAFTLTSLSFNQEALMTPCFKYARRLVVCDVIKPNALQKFYEGYFNLLVDLSLNLHIFGLLAQLGMFSLFRISSKCIFLVEMLFFSVDK